MMPNPVKMLSDIPGALHVEVADAGGVWRDGVLTEVSRTRGAGEYGFPGFEGDTVYVAAPFSAPAAALRVKRDGKTVVRRIEGVADSKAFFAIAIGEVLDESRC